MYIALFTSRALNVTYEILPQLRRSHELALIMIEYCRCARLISRLLRALNDIWRYATWFRASASLAALRGVP